jgi:hypothetical protein
MNSSNSNDNRHLNPSRHKIIFSAHRKPPGTSTLMGHPSGSDDKNGSQSRGNLPSSSLSLLY